MSSDNGATRPHPGLVVNVNLDTSGLPQAYASCPLVVNISVGQRSSTVHTESSTSTAHPSNPLPANPHSNVSAAGADDCSGESIHLYGLGPPNNLTSTIEVPRQPFSEHGAGPSPTQTSSSLSSPSQALQTPSDSQKPLSRPQYPRRCASLPPRWTPTPSQAALPEYIVKTLFNNLPTVREFLNAFPTSPTSSRATSPPPPPSPSNVPHSDADLESTYPTSSCHTPSPARHSESCDDDFYMLSPPHAQRRPWCDSSSPPPEGNTCVRLNDGGAAVE
ncbi:hypothetical protein C8Q77DRAFT_1143513 [Trametes polyzona]|nr:hypothetical protein C8Q77DRAFT_1143513 [Trametes polyzona]